MVGQHDVEHALRTYRMANPVLAAESLMLCGKYQAALEEFSQAGWSRETNPEGQFKCLCLRGLVEVLDIREQTRTPSAEGFRAIEGEGDKGFLAYVYNFDALSHEAWFNLGIVHFRRKQFRSALVSFGISTLTHRNCRAAWTNAYLAARRNHDTVVAALVCTCGKEIFGREFHDEVSRAKPALEFKSHRDLAARL